MEGKRCLVKKKTRTARRTLEPLYQQQLEFKVEFTGKTLQASDIAMFYWLLNQRIFRVVHRGDFIAVQELRFGAILARSAEVSFSCKQIWQMVGEVSPVVQSTFYAFISWAMAGVLWAHKWTDSSCQCMLTSALTVNMFKICKENASCCPLIHDITLRKVALHYITFWYLDEKIASKLRKVQV